MTTQELITAFHQGGTGNCVSVAIIKASMEVFGLGHVFDTEPQADGSQQITLRDGTHLALTVAELDYARQHSLFVLGNNQQVLDHANFCYAVIAKRVQQDEKGGVQSYAEAIDDLNNGAYYLEAPRWLGLQHYVRAVGLRYVQQYAGVIGASPHHCFFASHKLADDHGQVDPIRWFDFKYKLYHYLRLDTQPVY
jgi:hypothetical protein